MKWTHMALAWGLVVLCGCTTTPQQPGGPGTASTSATTPTHAAPHASTAVARKNSGLEHTGDLQPITTGKTGTWNVAQTRTPNDLWDRIRRGYGIPDLDNELVQDREQWYTARPDYIVRMTERSRKYLFHIVEEIERRNMPTELALLPFIESAFNPQAMSSAKAAGMWQFIPSTGKYFDLKQNIFRDDRRDVLASTRAALDYLQKLYGMFGDWQLALAAYNWGEGSVQRAIAKNQRAGLGVSYSELNTPMETRLYIPKLQAVKNIVAAPDARQIRLPDIPNHPYFQQVPIQRDIDVALAAKLAEVPLDDFKALNPSANRPVILASGTPQILLPWDNATVFQQNLEAYASNRLASWTAWIAPSTMKPADVARQVGMSEAEFRAINNVPPRMLVKAGSTLLVPRSSQRQDDVAVSVADNAQLNLAPEIVLRKSMVKARGAESVAALAKRYNVSASSVAEWNNTPTAGKFKAGQSVVVYLPVVVKTGSKTAGAKRATPPAHAAKTAPAKTNSVSKIRVAKR